MRVAVGIPFYDRQQQCAVRRHHHPLQRRPRQWLSASVTSAACSVCRHTTSEFASARRSRSTTAATEATWREPRRRPRGHRHRRHSASSCQRAAAASAGAGEVACSDGESAPSRTRWAPRAGADAARRQSSARRRPTHRRRRDSAARRAAASTPRDGRSRQTERDLAATTQTRCDVPPRTPSTTIRRRSAFGVHWRRPSASSGRSSRVQVRSVPDQPRLRRLTSARRSWTTERWPASQRRRHHLARTPSTCGRDSRRCTTAPCPISWCSACFGTDSSPSSSSSSLANQSACLSPP